MYVCGPTVYNYIHVGNARTFISFDNIRRYLMWRGFDVKFVQNVTDVDDKIIAKSLEEGRSAAEVAAEVHRGVHRGHAPRSSVLDPDVRPKATEEIPAMIELISASSSTAATPTRWRATCTSACARIPDYGAAVRAATWTRWRAGTPRAARRRQGHRGSQARPAGLRRCGRPPSPASRRGSRPWGQGRPGWHIECSAMSRKYLGAALRHPRRRRRPRVPAPRERARPERGRVRLHVRELLDARRHAADQRPRR